MSKKTSRPEAPPPRVARLTSPIALGAYSGLAAVLGFPPISLWFLLPLSPALLYFGLQRSRSLREAVAVGFAANFAIMFGAFYWVTYVLHIFGDMGWVPAGLLYALFAGLGALHFPIFGALAFRLRGRLAAQPTLHGFAFCALFLTLDWATPKLFPWTLGHGLFPFTLAIQAADLFGVWGITWAIWILGVALAARSRVGGGVALGVWIAMIAYGALRLPSVEADLAAHGRELRFALIQADIGSLDKFAARHGVLEKIRYVIDRYLALTREALAKQPATELVMWPETAVPFSLDSTHYESLRVRNFIREINRPLLTGAYAPDYENRALEYNAAYLLTPEPSGQLRQQIYRKHALLAFGEYFPGGEWFPQLYRWFPTVSHFARGHDLKALILPDGTPVGVTICYEAIRPEYFHRIGQPGLRLSANLTNDSWFGPTSEPYQHAALASFRAIESRVPLLRVTNTGTSFAVEATGRAGTRTGVYEEGIVVGSVRVPNESPSTIYVRFGDWFVALQACFVLSVVGWARRRAKGPRVSVA